MSGARRRRRTIVRVALLSPRDSGRRVVVDASGRASTVGFTSAMKSLNGFLRAHTWVVFLGHQAFLFATAVGFLYSVRRLTGRAVHLGRDPLGVPV